MVFGHRVLHRLVYHVFDEKRLQNDSQIHAIYVENGFLPGPGSAGYPLRLLAGRAGSPKSRRKGDAEEGAGKKSKFSEARRNVRGCRGGTKGGFHRTWHRAEDFGKDI